MSTWNDGWIDLRYNSTRTIIIVTILALGVGIVIGTSINAEAQTSLPSIPKWIKNTAKWWGEGQTSDTDFINAIQWLIDQKIIVISNNVQPSSTPIQQTQQVTATSLNNLLPTRDDISTEWIIQDVTPFKKNATGFVDGLSQSFTMGSDFLASTSTVAVYKFDSSDDANKYYDNFVSTSRASGGYTEWMPGGINADKCYGKQQDYPGGRINSLFCIKGNFGAGVVEQGTDLDISANVQKFTTIVLNKL